MLLCNLMLFSLRNMSFRSFHVVTYRSTGAESQLVYTCISAQIIYNHNLQYIQTDHAVLCQKKSKNRQKIKIDISSKNYRWTKST